MALLVGRQAVTKMPKGTIQLFIKLGNSSSNISRERGSIRRQSACSSCCSRRAARGRRGRAGLSQCVATSRRCSSDICLAFFSALTGWCQMIKCRCLWLMSWTCVVINEHSTSLGYALGSAMPRGTARGHRGGDRYLVSLFCSQILSFLARFIVSTHMYG